MARHTQSAGWNLSIIYTMYTTPQRVMKRSVRSDVELTSLTLLEYPPPKVGIESQQELCSKETAEEMGAVSASKGNLSM